MFESLIPNFLKSEKDICLLIENDHIPLKDFIKIMKGTGLLLDKVAAFEQFSPLLIAHSKPEESSLYEVMKNEGHLRQNGIKGDTEHALADALIEEIRGVKEEEEWQAKVKVLAELVEHHIHEEEHQMLPLVKERFSLAEREAMGEAYLQIRADLGIASHAA